MKTLTLETEGSLTDRKQTLVLHGSGTNTHRVHMETNVSLADPETLDGQLCSVIFHAMRHCRKLQVKGAISRTLFRNIRLFQEAWHCHCPGDYQLAEIEPEAVIAPARAANNPAEGRTIQTFSGGVDSIFTLFRDHDRASDPAAQTGRTALLVHGFDVPLSKQADFDSLRKRIEKITNSAGVELQILRTSLRDSLPSNWNHSHGAALAGALHLFSSQSRTGIIASSDPYNYVSFVPHAWGSSPATDYLLSGGEMEIIHDGAGFSRPQKIASLAANRPEALSLSQFCWQGKDRSANCGKCDKCIQTRLALRASGNSESLCFSREFEPGMINALKFSEETLGDILPLLDLARETNCNEPWVQSIAEQINPFLPVMYKSNRSVGRSIRYFKAALRELLPT